MDKNYVVNYKGDCLSQYFKELRNTELLTLDEEINLVKRIKENNDEKAINRLVLCNLKFVVKIAKEYQNKGIPLSDLINEGNYGLIKAATKFDHTRGFRFISYAVWWIRQSIIHSLNVDARVIRLPANVISQLSKIKQELIRFENQHEREATSGEILNIDGGSDIILISTPKVNSLNSKVNYNDGSELYELLEDKSYNNDEKYVINDEVKDELHKTLSILDARELDIIKSYFGVNTEHNGMTLDDIGTRYSLTKERIRQIKEKAIRKLKHNSHNLFEIINH